MSLFTHTREVSHAEAESASSAPASYDDNDDEPPPLPLTNTKTSQNYDQYGSWTSQVVQPYPSPPHSDSNPSRNIPLPIPPLAGHGDYRGKEGALELTTDSRDHRVKFYHAGGVLDSPIIHFNPHAGPLSPPPTLPTQTTTLPCAADVEGIEADSDISAWLNSEFGGRARNLVVSLPATHSATSEAQLLSPLSPEFITDPAGIHRQRNAPTLSLPVETLDNPSSFSPYSSHGFFPSEPMDLDTFIAEAELEQDVEMRPSLEEEEELWLAGSLYSPHSNDFNGRCGDSTPTDPHSVHYRRDFNHTFYPSPDISPEQSISRPSPHTSSIPSMKGGLRVHEPPQERHIDLADDGYDYEDMDYQHDLLGSQSPSIRTLGLPELDDEDDEMDLGLGLSNFASFPPSTFARDEDELPFSSLPSTPSSAWPSPILSSPFAPSSETSEAHMTDEFDSGSLNLPPSSSTSNLVATGLLLLDSESDSSTTLVGTRSPSLSPPSSISSSICDDSSSPSSSLAESLESLDSRLFILPSLLGTGEYPTLDAHPELVGDLNRLMELRRKTQGKVKELEVKVGKGKGKGVSLTLGSSLDLGSGSGSGSGSPITSSISQSSSTSLPSSSTDRVLDDGREVEGKNVVLRRVALAQTQNERAEARATRKREKERWKEIGALVQLTVFGERRRQRREWQDEEQDHHQDHPQSRSNSKSTVAEAKVVAETVTRDLAMGLPRAEQVQSSPSAAFANKKKKDEKVSITNMAQLVARMILRRRDSSYSPSPSRPVSYVSRLTRSGGLISSPPSGTRRYAKSPLWQSMTISYDEGDDVSSGSVGSGTLDGVLGDDDDDDDLGLGIGLRGFGDFGASGS